MMYPDRPTSHLHDGLLIMGKPQSPARVIDILDIRTPQNGALTHLGIRPRSHPDTLILYTVANKPISCGTTEKKGLF